MPVAESTWSSASRACSQLVMSRTAADSAAAVTGMIRNETKPQISLRQVLRFETGHP